MSKQTDKLIALAGVVQAVTLVDQLGRTGTCDSNAFDASIHSLFTFDAQSTLDVYGGKEHLMLGIESAIKLLNSSAGSVTGQYALGIVQIQKMLAQDKARYQRVGKGLEAASVQAAHFSETHENVLSNINALYASEISSLSFRIQVRGEPEHLQRDIIAYKIRSLLMAAVRSAHLWRQKGGSRLDLVFRRKKLIDGLTQLAKS